VLGDYVDVESWPVKRVISLSSGLTESLYMMGLGDLIVGTDAFSNRPEEARRKPKVGSYTHVNIEAMKDLRPDVVLTITGVQRGIAEKLRREGIPVYPLPMPTDVAGIISNVSVLGYITGYIGRARELASKLFKKISELIPEEPVEGKSVLVALDFGPRGGLWSPGGASHISDAIHMLGGISVSGGEPVSYIETRRAIRGVDHIDIVIYENSSYITSEKPIGYRSLIEALGEEGIRYGRVEVFYEETMAHTGPSFILDSMAKLREIILQRVQR